MATEAPIEYIVSGHVSQSLGHSDDGWVSISLLHWINDLSRLDLVSHRRLTRFVHLPREVQSKVIKAFFSDVWHGRRPPRVFIDKMSEYVKLSCPYKLRHNACFGDNDLFHSKESRSLSLDKLPRRYYSAVLPVSIVFIAAIYSISAGISVSQCQLHHRFLSAVPSLRIP
jgi:hypothetical protein